jgi:hypothetical protein
METTKNWKNKLFVSIVLLVLFGGIGQTAAHREDPPYFEGDVVLTKDSFIRVHADNSDTYYTVSGTSALAALDAASQIAGFDYSINDDWIDSFGLLVNEIAGKSNEGYDGWQYWVNYPHEDIPMVSAENYELAQGDTIDWFYGGYGSNPDSTEMDIRIHITLQEDTTSPFVEILSPKQGGIYLFGTEISILPLSFSIVLGDLHVEINAYDEVSSIHRIEVCIDDSLKKSMYIQPYMCRFTGFGSGKHVLKVIAYDIVGNKREKDCTILLLAN